MLTKDVKEKARGTPHATGKMGTLLKVLLHVALG